MVDIMQIASQNSPGFCEEATKYPGLARWRVPSAQIQRAARHTEGMYVSSFYSYGLE